MSFPDWLPESHRPTGPNQRPRSRVVDPLLRPIVRFLHIETAGGFLLLACTAVALALANSAWSDWFAEIWQTRLGFSFGAFELNKPLLLWINDGAMTIFFFVIGLEISLLRQFAQESNHRKSTNRILSPLRIAQLDRHARNARLHLRLGDKATGKPKSPIAHD